MYVSISFELTLIKMKDYTTKFVRSFRTGEPFIFPVKEEVLDRLERQKQELKNGEYFYFCSTEKELVLGFEFSLFNSYESVRKIFCKNGYTNELITKILKDFEVSDEMITRLIENREFVSKVKPWFEGITCDGGRAMRTLKFVYCQVLTFYQEIGVPDIKSFTDFESMSEYMISVFEI
jgi:hypothetical protein